MPVDLHADKPGMYFFKGTNRNNETEEVYKLPICRPREYTRVPEGIKHWDYGTGTFTIIALADFQPPCYYKLKEVQSHV